MPDSHAITIKQNVMLHGRMHPDNSIKLKMCQLLDITHIDFNVYNTVSGKPCQRARPSL